MVRSVLFLVAFRTFKGVVVVVLSFEVKFWVIRFFGVFFKRCFISSVEDDTVFF